MKKQISILLISFLSFYASAQNLYPQLFDQSGGIANGYGSWGNYNYTKETSINVAEKGTITFYHPDIAMVQKPTVFFISGWEITYESYDRFFKYLAGLGYSVVNIYNTHPGRIHTSYQNSLDMMQQAVNTYSGWIDTSKVALMGHSYGGGASIWLGKQIFDPNGLNWGANGRFIIMFAPWLSFLMEDTDLQNYPPDVKLLVLQSYDDFHDGSTTHYNTDPRAVRAVYELIDIPDSDKDYITVFSDPDPDHQYSYGGDIYSYQANHYVSYTDFTDGCNNPFDALDVYLSNRLAHAMLDYVFEGNTAGKNVALGNGSAEQKDMGIMPDLAVTDYYITNRPESVFEYKCSENEEGTWGDPDIWKLQYYCVDANGDGVIDTCSVTSDDVLNFVVYPNPSSDFINIQTGNNNTDYRIYAIDGKLLSTGNLRYSQRIDVEHFSKGVYFIRIGKTVQRFTKK